MNISKNKTLQALLQHRAERFRETLKTEAISILDSWIHNPEDLEKRGVYDRIGGDNHMPYRRERSVVHHTQMLWTFAMAARLTGHALYRRLADETWHYLRDYFVDEMEGGVFWRLDDRGEPLQTQKKVYAQAFTIYAFSEYYRLSGNREALRQSLETFFLLERYSSDRVKGGYLEAFSRGWMAPEEEGPVPAAKTLRTHLHILEAYTNLCRVSPDATVRESLRTITRCILDRFIDPESFHLRLLLDEDWKSISNGISHSYDMETSWLLPAAAELLEEPELTTICKQTALTIARSTLAGSIDKNGEKKHESTPITYPDPQRQLWSRPETLAGFLNAFRIGREAEFFVAAEESWQLIKAGNIETLPGDTGEDETGDPNRYSYHQVRACLLGVNYLSALF